jgi:hypothetical protein
MSRHSCTVRRLSVGAMGVAVLSVFAGSAAWAAWSGSGSGTAAAGALSVGSVTGASKTASTTTSVTLSWTAPTASAGAPVTYAVTRGATPVACASASATTCADTGLTPSATPPTFTYTIAPKLGSWTGTAATVANVGPLAQTASAPSAPTTVTVSNGCVGWSKNRSTTTTVSWTASAGATGYKIYTGATSNAPGATPVSTVGSVTTTELTYDVNGNTSYYFWVAATNPTGDSVKTLADQHVVQTTSSSGSCSTVAN